MKTLPLCFFRIGARFFFALTILLAPFRLRLVVWERPYYPLYSDYTDFLLFAGDLVIACMFVFWAGSLIVEPRKVQAGHPLMLVLLAGLTLAAWVSAAGSVDAILTRYHAFRFTALLFFYLYIVNEIISVAWVLVPAALQGLTQAVAALGQSFAQSSLGFRSLGEQVLDPLVHGTSILPVNGERFLRAYGFADHPNILGGCLAFVLVLLLAVVLYGRNRQTILGAGAFLVILPALLVTFSRSAWVALFVAAGFMAVCEALARRWDSLKRLVLLGLLGLAVASPLLIRHLSAFDQRFNSGNIAGDGPMFERAFLLKAGNTLFVEHSAFGVGLGASPLAFKLRFDYFPLNFQPPHFTPLLAALETGVFGGGFYLLIFAFPFISFLLRWREFLHRPILLGAFALLLALSVVNLFDYYTWTYTPGRTWQWLAWGVFSAALHGGASNRQALQ